jgi:hypothetical protein
MSGLETEMTLSAKACDTPFVDTSQCRHQQPEGPRTSEENLFVALFALTNDIPNQVLANSIRRAVGIGETILRKNFGICPRARLSAYASHEECLPLSGETPVGVKHRGHQHRAVRAYLETLRT